MTYYILIQRIKSKMQILSARNRYVWRFGGLEIVPAPWFEAYIGTNIYQGNFDTVSATLRSSFPEISTFQIDLAFQSFIKSHPLTPVKYHMQDTPLFADKETDLVVSSCIYKYPIQFTEAHEQELLSIVCSKKIPDRWTAGVQWLAQFRFNYGIDTRYKRDRDSQDAELLSLFCDIHGIDYNVLLSEVGHISLGQVGLSLLGVILVLLGIGLAIAFFVWFANGFEEHNCWPTVVFCCFCLIVGLPELIKKRRNRR